MVFEKLLLFLSESWLVLGQMAPYLLFGFLIAGLLSVWIAPQWIERHLGGKGFVPVVKASLFGVPLPLCSCGIIPVAASLRQNGASRAATVSFLLSTPQTGVDSIAITYALLGPVFAVFRPVAAFFTGILGGGLVLAARLNGDKRLPLSPAPAAVCADDCCAAPIKKKNILLEIIDHGFRHLPGDIGGALLFGVAVAGLISALVPTGSLAPYLGAGILSILIMMVVGVPLYVCATASVPIAVGFLHMGASPGAALAFLIAGPATNAATITTTWKVLGPKTALLYLFTVALSAVFSGLTLDWLTPLAGGPTMGWMEHRHATAGPSAINHLWAALMLGLVVYASFIYPRIKKMNISLPEKIQSGEQTLELTVTGMTCSHCSATVQRGLEAAPGVRSAVVDLSTGKVKVFGKGLDAQHLTEIVKGLGYGVAGG